MTEEKQSFFLLSLSELQEAVISAGFQKYRAKQIFDCVYKNKIFEPSKMSSLPLDLRTFLANNYEFIAVEAVGKNLDTDKTGKFLYKLSDGKYVECVLLEAPAEDGKIRKTLCLSTQVGCACGCKFCASTMRGFFRNLTASEIISETLPFASKEKNFEFENIVVMGMGEPLLNLENLKLALNVLNSPDKFGFGARRITVSTCGIADKLSTLAKEKFPFRLAISLHGASDEIRSQIMPINKRFPLKVLLNAAEDFAKSCGRMITLEFILINKLNDSPEQARLLAGIAKKLHAHINLIPYNKVEGLEWERSTKQRIADFTKILDKEKSSYTLRREKGSDISAACGQLALKENS